MSVINQMLQDLDARNSDGAATHNVHEQVKVVAIQKTLSTMRLLGFVLFFVLLASGAGFLWVNKFMPNVNQAKVNQVLVSPPQQIPAQVLTASPTPVPTPAPTQNSPSAPIQANEVPQDLVLKIASDLNMTQSASMRSLAMETSTPSLAANSMTQETPKFQAESHRSVAKQEKKERTALPIAKEDRLAIKSAVVDSMIASQVREELGAKKASDATTSSSLEKKIKELTPQQRAENEYRKATSLIAQNKSAEALPMLEQSLKIDPTNASARQALVRLMLETKRQDDAIKILQEGLSLDQSHTGMAMILARLQVEKGDYRTAMETLHRGLPHAADKPDYHAFLAALLQRQAQHKEAIEHYSIAVRKTPQNGVWWMGLGISLQAENRIAESQDAFTKARASNSLSPELQAFVDQKLSH